MSEEIYLDHNATSPIASDVLAFMLDEYGKGYVNPASQHRPGQVARRTLEEYRSRIAAMLGAETTGMLADRLVFTSGGTESDNLAVIGLALAAAELREPASDAGHRGRILVSAIEHPAVMAAADQLSRMGFVIERIPVNRDGVCEPKAVSDRLDESTLLVSVMLANNETGALQPVEAIARICRQSGVWMHTDAVQAVGKIPVHFRQLGVDALSFTAHKFAGPRGVGGLLLRTGMLPAPMFHGGFQQSSIRPGTEDVVLAAGCWKALDRFHQNPDRQRGRLASMRDRLQMLITAQYPDAVVHAAGVDRVPQTLNIAFPGVDRQSFLMAADMAGLAVSAGSACASGSSEPSPVLTAMGLDPSLVNASIRISVGDANTESDMDAAFDRIVRIVDRQLNAR